MGIKLNILTFVLLIGTACSSKHFEVVEIADSSSSETSEEYVQETASDETYPEDIVLFNLKALLRSGDSDFGVPIWAPYIDDNVVVE